MLSIKKFWQEYSFPLGVFALWRLALLLVGFIAQSLLPFRYSFPYADTILVPSGLPQWLWQWGNFDGVHYLTLAKSGYDGFGTQVFFPLYPMLINLVGRLIPNPLISGLLISNLSVLVAALVLYRLVKDKFDQKTARWTTIFLFAFPTSFFFGGVYTEALFLLLVLLTFSYSKIFAFFAGATRLVGIFLGPFAWVGLVAYSVYLGIRFGQPLFFLSAQSAFGNSRADSFFSLVNPLQVIFRYLKIFLTADPAHYDFWIAGLEFIAFIGGAMILGWLTFKRGFPKSWLIYSWGALLLPSLSGTFSSMPRYLLAIFPIFIGLAQIKNWWVKLAMTMVFVILLIILTTLFTRGYWVS